MRPWPRLAALPAVSGAIPGAPVAVRSFTAWNTSAVNVARVKVHNGSGTDGVVAIECQLNPSESVRERWDPEELVLDVGCYVEIAAGAVEGSIGLQELDVRHRGGDPEAILDAVGGPPISLREAYEGGRFG